MYGFQNFEDFKSQKKVPFFELRGKPHWPLGHVERVFGYAPGSLGGLIRREWRDEFIKGEDYMVLRGADLRRLKEQVGDSPWVDLRRVSALTLLSEEGMFLAACLSRRPLGRKLRRWLIDEVLPQIARYGDYIPGREIDTWRMEWGDPLSIIMKAVDESEERKSGRAASRTDGHPSGPPLRLL